MRSAVAIAAVALAAAASPAPAATAAGPGGLLPARAMIVVDRSIGTVLFARHPTAELPMASLTKLMTAHVTILRSDPGATFVEQPYHPQPSESLAGVPACDRLGLADMLRAMLLPSGNDVAHSLALDVGTTQGHFLALMNREALRLHLDHTHYTTPVGIDTPGNHSTALDLARLARIVLRSPLLAAIVDERVARLADGVVVRNINRLLAAHPWVVGVKTGDTPNSGYCMIGAARRGGVEIISVVLGARSEHASDLDTLTLLRYGLQRVRSVPIALAGRSYATRGVVGRAHASARIVAARSLTLQVDRRVRLHAARVVPRRLRGPMPAGTQVGAIEVAENGRTVATVPLVTAAAVPAPAAVVRPPPRLATVATRRLAWIALGCALTIVLAGCSLMVMRRRMARGSIG